MRPRVCVCPRASARARARVRIHHICTRTIFRIKKRFKLLFHYLITSSISRHGSETVSSAKTMERNLCQAVTMSIHTRIYLLDVCQTGSNKLEKRLARTEVMLVDVTLEGSILLETFYRQAADLQGRFPGEKRANKKADKERAFWGQFC